MFVKNYYPMQDITEVVEIHNPYNAELFVSPYNIGFYLTEAEANA